MLNIEAELDRSRNTLGTLSDDLKQRVRDVVADPCNATWDNAYSLIIGADGWMTFWQAVCQVDADFPRSKPADGRWPKVPDKETLVIALTHATTANVR